MVVVVRWIWNLLMGLMMMVAPTSEAEMLAPAFAFLDWVVLGGYGLLLAVTGYLVARRQRNKTTADYFLAGRSMPTWAVTISIIATSLSAATFIGGPEQAYRGNLTYLIASIGGVLGAVVVAFLFVPAFFKHEVSTVYELLEHRAGKGARISASVMFQIGRVFASGARLYIAALAASLIAFGDLETEHLVSAIVVFMVVGIAYTFVGGVASVIWTDVIQFAIFVGAALIAGLILLGRIPIGWDEIMTVLEHPDPTDIEASSKLTIFESGFTAGTINHSYTLFSALIGWTLFNLAAYGTDQDLSQRMLTCKSADRGSKSIIAAILLGIPVTFMFMGIGLLLFVFYKRADVMGEMGPGYLPADSRKIFLTFILREMPAGISGLMMAGLFAAGLSSLNSALNAMASAFTNDVYKEVRPGLTEREYLKTGRLAVVVAGLLLGMFAIVCVFWQQGTGQSLIDFALGVMMFAYTGLLGVFLTVLLTKTRGNTWSVIGALLAGFTMILLFQPSIWERIRPESWGDFTLAFPWRMVAGSVVATSVCLLGKSKVGHDGEVVKG